MTNREYLLSVSYEEGKIYLNSRPYEKYLNDNNAFDNFTKDLHKVFEAWLDEGKE